MSDVAYWARVRNPDDNDFYEVSPILPTLGEAKLWVENHSKIAVPYAAGNVHTVEWVDGDWEDTCDVGWYYDFRGEWIDP